MRAHHFSCSTCLYRSNSRVKVVNATNGEGESGDKVCKIFQWVLKVTWRSILVSPMSRNENMWQTDKKQDADTAGVLLYDVYLKMAAFKCLRPLSHWESEKMTITININYYNYYIIIIPQLSCAVIINMSTALFPHILCLFLFIF